MLAGMCFGGVEPLHEDALGVFQYSVERCDVTRDGVVMRWADPRSIWRFGRYIRPDQSDLSQIMDLYETGNAGDVSMTNVHWLRGTVGLPQRMGLANDG